MLALLLGALCGGVLHHLIADAERLKALASLVSMGSDIFLRLIKMIIAPLVLATVVTGATSFRDGGSLGRIAAKALLWFFSASLASLGLGLLFSNLFSPGAGLRLAVDASAAPPPTSHPSARDIIVHIVPTSLAEAMAGNDVLQILVFALFLGAALNGLTTGRGERIRGLIDELSQVMLRMTDLVMRLAPIGVFCAIAAVIMVEGPTVLVTYGRFLLTFYLALGVLSFVLLAAGAAVLGSSILSLVRLLREPLLVAFSTASSEAAFPKMLEQMRAFGVPERVSGFVLPLGYAFNLDGSMMYQAFAALFVAQAYGIHLSLGAQVSMLLLMMVMSKGMAGVPRGALVVVAAVLPMFHLPPEGLLLVLGVDQLLDMGRTATNVIGNGVATAVVARWEGALPSQANQGD